MRERLLVICPGRGSYTRETMGYLSQNQPRGFKSILEELDQYRLEEGEPSLTELDSMPSFKSSIHTKGEHASALIFACALKDFMSIDKEGFEIAAITGNSMGWYIAMALAETLSVKAAYKLIQGMGSMMKDKVDGGQIIYPIVDENWREDEKTIRLIEQALEYCRSELGLQAHVSIQLGGFYVIAGEKEALSHLMKILPEKEPYPFQLVNHAAFHSPILNWVSEKAFHTFPRSWFAKPKYPLIDGNGWAWSTYSAHQENIYQYTLGEQVTKTYSYTACIETGIKEFAPDRLALLGPGNSLGSATAQVLIRNAWRGLISKEDFVSSQKKDPYLVSMGIPDQRQILTF